MFMLGLGRKWLPLQENNEERGGWGVGMGQP